MGLNDQEPPQPPPARLQQRAGDRAIQIGQVVGNIVIQLITLKAAIAIMAALAIVATILFYVSWWSQQPARMTGDFNIAVAEFGEVTDQGIVSSALARQLSKLLFDFLDTEYRATDFGLAIQVAHDRVGILTEDRQAEQRAHDMGADIVIYGSVCVFEDRNEATLSPKFYVADQPEAAELTGQHQLALPIEFDISSLGFQDYVNTQLRARAATLVHFTEGLAYLSASDLDAAAYCFQEAVRQADRRGPFDGQEVLYLFMAVADRLQGNFEQAAETLDHALSLNPEYARAYLARGNIYYVQAVASWDRAKLDQALSEYQRALEAHDQPPGAYVRQKAHISLGNVYVIQAQQTNDPESFAQAISYYDQVVSEYEETQNERIRGLAAIAYFGLGAAYERQRDYARATDAYRQCINLAPDPELKSRAEDHLNLIQG